MKNQESRRRAYTVCLIMLTWAALLISVRAYGNTPQPAESPMEAERDTETLNGERMFRSREFKKAREAFEKALLLDSQDAQAHYFLGLIEYEEGNVEKAKTRFQIAYECLGSSLETSSLPPDTEQLQLEFPREYEARVYYKDGWYIKPKDASAVNKDVHSLEVDSTYRIELKPKRKESWIRRGMIGLVLAFSFFLAR